MARLRREVDEACLMRRGIHCTEEIDTLSESQKTPTALGKPSQATGESKPPDVAMAIARRHRLLLSIATGGQEDGRAPFRLIRLKSNAFKDSR